jgi:membrane protein YdbS with pleckstrin-like domain
MLSVVDARMEAPLTAFIIFGIWQMVEYSDKRKFSNLLLGALGAALAFSTKGWLGPVIIFITMFFFWLLNRNWSWVRDPKTWLFIPVFFLFISPVIYAYYIQYDLHPEKMIRGRSGHSGVRFILWNQLFERAGGFDVKERNGDYFFLYHTFLWAFFPWSIVAYVALVNWIGRIFKRENRNQFLFTALSFAFVLFTISFSKFKMPHYIIMLLPLAAMFTAPYLQRTLFERSGRKWIYPTHMFFAITVLLLTIALNFYFFHPINIGIWVFSVIVLLAFVWMVGRKFSVVGEKSIWISIGMSLLLNFFLNYNFFPQLMHYQGGNELVKIMHDHKSEIPDSSIYLLELNAHSFDFYRGHNHRTVEAASFETVYSGLKDKYFLTSSFINNYLRQKGFIIQPVFTHVDYNVAILKFKFLNPSTRSSTLDSLMLVKIYK